MLIGVTSNEGEVSVVDAGDLDFDDVTSTLFLSLSNSTRLELVDLVDDVLGEFTADFSVETLLVALLFVGTSLCGSNVFLFALME